MKKIKENYRKIINERLEKEKTHIIKNFRKDFKVLLVYPNSYYVGMSNLGFHSIYAILNSLPNVTCERSFLPEFDLKPLSYETLNFPLSFDLIIFSISFEIDFLNLIKFLELSEIPIFSKDRHGYPYIAVGGIAVTLNYRSISKVADYFLIGEGEELIVDFVNKVMNGEKADKIFYPDKKRVIYTGDYVCHSVISTNDTEFSDTLLVEIARGCHFKCKFCAASYNYSPYRIKKFDKILDVFEREIDIFNKVGIVGASVTSHPDFLNICKWLNSNQIKFTLTSLRLDTVTTNILEELKKGGNKTFTVAVESGSEDLRNKLGKKLSDKIIFNAIEKFIESKIVDLKFYFMIGFPFENFTDIENIVKIVKDIKDIYLSKRKILKKLGSFSISVNPFIPKPNTPFYKYNMEKEDVLNVKIKYLKDKFRKIANINFQNENLYSAYLQGLLSKTDMDLTDLLIEKNEKDFKNKAFFKKNYKLFEKFIF